MKRFLFALLTILVANASVSAYAQQKGDKFIGTMYGIGFQKTNLTYKQSGYNTETVQNGDPAFTFLVQPGFHYFVKDNFRIGLDASFMRKHQDGEVLGVSYEVAENSFLLGPTVAKYVQLTDNFYYTIEGGVYFTFASSTNDAGTEYNDQNAMGVSVDVSPLKFEFRPTTHVAFAVSLFEVGFAHMKFRDTGAMDIKSNSFVVNLGVTPSVGVHFYL